MNQRRFDYNPAGENDILSHPQDRRRNKPEQTYRQDTVLPLPKGLYLALFFTLLAVNIFSVRNWQIHTNTTHIFDLMEFNGKIYQATWGGLEVYNIEKDFFEHTYTLFDGLEDQIIRSISMLPSSETILLGTAKSGINRMKDGIFYMPINEIIGLPDGRVDILATSDSLIYAVTGEALAVFVDSPGFPFPLPVNHHTTDNGVASNIITSLALADDYLFLGTDKGLNIVHTALMNYSYSWHLLTTENSSLPGNHITSISINEDMIAIGTRSGLVRAKFEVSEDDAFPLTFSEWRNYQVGESAIDSNLIHSVFIDSNFNLWFSHGVWSEENLYLEETRNIVVTMIEPDGTFNGWYLDDGTGLFTDQIMGFKEINGTIYLYTWGEGLFFLHENNWVNRQPSCIAANNITDISVDKNGVVWVCNGFIGPDYQMRANPGVSAYDGTEWRTFRARNSDLIHDKVFRITTDAKNRKWFGTWNHGISVYDEDNDKWYLYNHARGLPQNTVGALTTDADDNIWISAYSGGLVVLDIDAIEQTTITPLEHFHINEPIYFSDVIEIFLTKERAYFGSFYSGIRLWNKPGLPSPNPEHEDWLKPPPSDLTDGFVYIYGIDSRETHWGQEIWIAAERGYLFMHDTVNDRWYRYGTGIKREVWLNNTWQRDRLYFMDEERLFGAAPTIPTAILVDPFDRIWIGTESNGLTMYDLTTDRFTIYNTANSPLLSNSITRLAYEPFSGRLYIGSNDGLNSVEIGKTQKRKDVPLKTIIAYPNPFYPDRGQSLTIFNEAGELDILPIGKNECRIFNINGELVITLNENRYYEFSWDGKNEEGKKCGSGIYFYLISSPGGQTDRGTIVLVR